MKVKKITLLILTSLIILVLVGCSPKQEQSNDGAPSKDTPETATLTDGDYTAYSDADPESKGEARVQLTIKDGKITDVKIDEIEDGTSGHALKDLANYPLQAAVDGVEYFKEQFIGLTTTEEINAVDDFAGITHSSASFKLATERALSKANSTKNGTYFDGTFMGYSDTSAENGFATAYVTVKDNVVISVVLQEWQPDPEKKGTFVLKDYTDYPLKEAKEGNEHFTKEFVGATSTADIEAVDDFAGVTHSSTDYKTATKMALEKAQKQL